MNNSGKEGSKIKYLVCSKDIFPYLFPKLGKIGGREWGGGAPPGLSPKSTIAFMFIAKMLGISNFIFRQPLNNC